MGEEVQPPVDAGVQPTVPGESHALDVSIGGDFKQRYPLRRDKPTWTGRRLHASCADHDYIQIPGSDVRWHCLFEWDAKKGRFAVTTGPMGCVWINMEDVGPQQRRFLEDGDVVIVSGESRGPRCVRLTLVRCEG